MNHTEFNKKQIIKYLVFTFVIAWIIQAIVGYLAAKAYLTVYQLIVMLMMIVPLTGVLFCRGSLKGMGWKPRFKGNVKLILIAWFAPAVLTTVGAALYFLIFPGHFDLSGSFLLDTVGEDALKQLEEQGLNYQLYLLITVIGCLTYAPLLNMFSAVGEEAGWRGFLYLQLKARFSKRTAWLIGGVIWGAWHWPLIWLIGYEYGVEYFGFPVLGMLVFLFFTVSLGIISDWLYEKSKCIWVPSIFHGSINAAATIPLAFAGANSASTRLLGPVPNGLIAGLPIIIFAVILLIKAEDKESEKEKNDETETV